MNKQFTKAQVDNKHILKAFSFFNLSPPSLSVPALSTLSWELLKEWKVQFGMKCRKIGTHRIFCQYKLLQLFYEVDTCAANKRWPWYWHKETRLRKNGYLMIWKKVIVNLLMINIEIVVWFVEESLSFTGKYWSVYWWNDRPLGFALKIIQGWRNRRRHR